MSEPIFSEPGAEPAEPGAEPAADSAPAAGPPSPPPPPFDNPAWEGKYHEELELLLNPRQLGDKTLLLLVTLALFVASSWVSDLETSMRKLLLLVGVLFFHEAGHWIGMRAFGYRDVRMFFIPFFGAAVSGARAGAAGWKEAVVLLLGPLPGICVGLGFAVHQVVGGDLSSWMRELALYLLFVNGLNLLPLAPLDGGRLFQLVLFSRQRHLEIAFMALGALALLVGGLLTSSWVLAIFGFFLLRGLPHMWRLIREAARLRERFPGLPAEAHLLGDEECRALFLAARDVLPEQLLPRRGAMAPTMANILERTSQHPPGWLASLGILLVWGVALLVMLGSAAIIVAHSPAAA